MKFKFYDLSNNVVEIDVIADYGRHTLDVGYTWEQLKALEQPISVAAVTRLLSEAREHAEKELRFANDIANAHHSLTANCADYVRMRRMGLLGDENYNALYYLHQKLIQPAVAISQPNVPSASHAESAEKPILFPDLLKRNLIRLLGIMDGPRFIAILESSHIKPEDIFLNDATLKININPLMPVDDANAVISNLRAKLLQLSQDAYTGRTFPVEMVVNQGQCYIAINIVSTSHESRRRRELDDLYARGVMDSIQRLLIDEERRRTQRREDARAANSRPSTQGLFRDPNALTTEERREAAQEAEAIIAAINTNTTECVSMRPDLQHM